MASQRGKGRILTGLWHGYLAHRCFRGILAWRRGLLTGLRHGDLAHRCFRGIPAWRRGLLDGLWHGHHAHSYLRGIPAWRRTNTDRPLARRPCPQMLQWHHGVAKGASGRSLARPPCPQVLQGHLRVAKSHLTKDKPVSARCKDRLSYRRAYRQTCRMVSYVGLTDRQTGLPYRQPYLKLSPTGSLGSSLPPTLPTGFVSQTFRPPDRQTYRMVSYVGLTDRQTGLPYRQPYQPDRPAASPVARPAASPASLTDQPNRPARPTSPTDRPDRPARPAILTSHPHRPSSPAIHPGKGRAATPYR